MNRGCVGGGGWMNATGSVLGLGDGIGAAPAKIDAAMARSSASAKPAATSTCAVVFPTKRAISLGLVVEVDRLQGTSQAASRPQIIRQHPLDLIKVAREIFAGRFALDKGALRGDLLLGIGDLRLHLAERIGVTVARHGAGGDRRLQLRASPVVGIVIGFEVIALELGFRLQKRRIRSRVAAAQSFGASTERRQFGLSFSIMGFRLNNNAMTET